jgi:hypothetical protein
MLSRYPVSAVVLGLTIAIAAPTNAAAAPGPHPAASQCTVTSYKPVRHLSDLPAAPRITFYRRLTVAPHTASRTITWSAPATAAVIAHATTAGGARTTQPWIWPAVARHYGQRVGLGGQRTARTQSSNGTFRVINHSARARHDIEYNSVTRFHGRYAATRCADVNTHGIGRVERGHGSWVTFSRDAGTGVVQCGAGDGGAPVIKAALTHCA